MKLLATFTFLALTALGASSSPLAALPADLAPGEDRAALDPCKPTDGLTYVTGYTNYEHEDYEFKYKLTLGTKFPTGTPSPAEAAAFFLNFANTLGESGHCL